MTTNDPHRPEERGSDDRSTTARGDRSDHHPVNWLLLVPLVLTLFPPIYNSIDPALADIPFFYWYQLAAIAIGVTCTLIVYRAKRG